MCAVEDGDADVIWAGGMGAEESFFAVGLTGDEEGSGWEGKIRNQRQAGELQVGMLR